MLRVASAADNVDTCVENRLCLGLVPPSKLRFPRVADNVDSGRYFRLQPPSIFWKAADMCTADHQRREDVSKGAAEI